MAEECRELFTAGKPTCHVRDTFTGSEHRTPMILLPIVNFHHSLSSFAIQPTFFVSFAGCKHKTPHLKPF